MFLVMLEVTLFQNSEGTTFTSASVPSLNPTLCWSSIHTVLTILHFVAHHSTFYWQNKRNSQQETHLPPRPPSTTTMFHLNDPPAVRRLPCRFSQLTSPVLSLFLQREKHIQNNLRRLFDTVLVLQLEILKLFTFRIIIFRNLAAPKRVTLSEVGFGPTPPEETAI